MGLELRAGWTALAWRLALPLMALTGSVWLLAPLWRDGMLADLPAALSRIGALQVAAALAATAASFWAVGRYDGVAHRHLRTDVARRDAEATGRIAIGLAQTLGLGVLSGALARWRMLPGLDMKTALALSAFVSISFMCALALVTALACLLLPAPAWTLLPSLAVLLAVPALVAVLFSWPRLTLRGRRIVLPSLPAAGAIALWTALDTAAAAAALWLLLPGVAPGFTVFLPVFLLALTAALLGGTPGGVGPFELVLLSALPQVPPADLLAAVLAFRAIYYALPATLAMLAMLRPLPARGPVARPRVLRDALGAEAGVLVQNGGHVAALDGVAMALWPTGQALVALSSLPRGSGPGPLHALRRSARGRNLVPCLYKCDAASAVTALRAGWRALHIADEAVLDPARFSAEVPARRGLRRKLRSAAKAGVRIEAARRLPLAEMARVDAAWQARNGGARGGTMGRYCPAYVAGQLVLLARAGDRLVGFATFHRTRDEWCLDLMRSTGDAPDGAMHMAIVEALALARVAGVRRLSLAAVPACPEPESAWMRGATTWLVTRSRGAGLRRFKSAFAPRWEPRYLAAPHAAACLLALADIAREVHRPAPLPSVPAAHHDHEHNEVEGLRAS
jgi:phosphatidylglycerol lysyltransferase